MSDNQFYAAMYWFAAHMYGLFSVLYVIDEHGWVAFGWVLVALWAARKATRFDDQHAEAQAKAEAKAQ